MWEKNQTPTGVLSFAWFIFGWGLDKPLSLFFILYDDKIKTYQKYQVPVGLKIIH